MLSTGVDITDAANSSKF